MGVCLDEISQTAIDEISRDNLSMDRLIELRQRLVVCRLISEEMETDIRTGKMAEKRLQNNDEFQGL